MRFSRSGRESRAVSGDLLRCEKRAILRGGFEWKFRGPPSASVVAAKRWAWIKIPQRIYE